MAQARYVAEPPRSITLYTVISNRNDSGAHSGLLINASEQVLFDPAGSWQHPAIPERNDVHFGITPKMVAYYIDYHARETFRVVEQTIVVSPEVAELVKQRAMAYGAVPKAQCANSISSILAGIPGFEGLKSTWFPNKLSDSFGTLPGVKSRTITDDDADSNHGVLDYMVIGNATSADFQRLDECNPRRKSLMPSWRLNRPYNSSGTPNNTTPPATMAAIMLRVANPTVKVASAAASRAGSVCPPVAAGQITAGATSAGSTATEV